MSVTLLNLPVLDPRSYPLVRPQLTCIDRAVYFGSYLVAHISTSEARFLGACTGERTLADAVGIAAVDAMCVARLANWILWSQHELPSAQNTVQRVDRLVLSASHIDAWCGMGGRLIKEAPACSTLVFTCFGSKVDTTFPDGFPSPAEISIACRREAAFAARWAGVHHQVSELPDDGLRAILERSGRDSNETVSWLLQSEVLDLIDRYQPSEIFAPAAVGRSPDARLVFDTLMALYANGEILAELYLYQDYPPSAHYRQVDQMLARFENSYLLPREIAFDITTSESDKRSLVDSFRCTVGKRDLDLWLEPYGSLHVPDKLKDPCTERFWKIDLAEIG